MHDFKKFPELTNRQMQFYYFESPHKQIMENFMAKVVKVTDGDTIRVECKFRDFDFPIKLKDIQAPEKGQEGYLEAKNYLEEQILGKEIEVIIDPVERVGKWGRILGRLMFRGVDMGEELVDLGLAVFWQDKDRDRIPEVEEWLVY